MLNDPPELTNRGGKFEFPSGPPFRVGDTAELKCDDGWVPPDRKTSTVVLRNGVLEWEPHEMGCFLLADQPLTPGKGVDKINSPLNIAVDNIATSTCKQGFEVGPESTARVVLRNGHLVWDKHELDCSESTLNDPPESTNHGGNFETPSGPPFRVGDTAELKCDDGWVPPDRKTSTVVLRNGVLKWQPHEMGCFLSADQALTPGKGVAGINTSNSIAVGTIAIAQCKPGYKVGPESTARVVLQNGQLAWDKHELECSTNFCDNPLHIPNAEPVLEFGFHFPDTFRYRCKKGYLVNRDVLSSCTERGMWDPPLHNIQCDSVECPNTLKAPWHGSLHMPSRTFTSIARFSCDEGYEMVGGSVERTCQEDGKWSGSEGVCRPIQSFGLITRTALRTLMSWVAVFCLFELLSLVVLLLLFLSMRV